MTDLKIKIDILLKHIGVDMDKKTIVVAIGGNALITDTKNVTVKSQYETARGAIKPIVKLIKDGHNVIITHGNGPQVGFILRRAEYARSILHSVPLDSCVADTQGAIGYQIQMAIQNELKIAGVNRPVATVVTQVEVDKDDPAFKNPTKPIGSFMSKEEAENQKRKEGWSIMEDANRGYRRVVASPKPKKIVELDAIKAMINAGVVTIAVGGGGIPVVKAANGDITGSEAVIDKDLATELLAKELNADVLLISTGVKKVCIDYGKPSQSEIDTMTTLQARKYISENQFAKGSMLPKVEAIIDFVDNTGKLGIITDPQNVYDAIYSDKYGTRITR